jgi:hypothetical protein
MQSLALSANFVQAGNGMALRTHVHACARMAAV